MSKRNLPNNKRLFRIFKKYSIFIIALLFVFSLTIPSVLAQISAPKPMVETQRSARQLAFRAKNLYQIGKFREAIAVWQEAADTFAKAGDNINQSTALSNLSLTYQKLGQWQEAEKRINKSLAILGTTPQGKKHAKTLAQTYNIQGKLQNETGDSDKAIATWGKASKIYKGIGDDDLATKSKFHQAQAMQDSGHYPHACKTLLEILGSEFNNVTCRQSLEDQIPGEHESNSLEEPELTDRLSNLAEELQDHQSLFSLKIKALHNLGDVLQVLGENKQSQLVLAHTLQLAEEQDFNQKNTEISGIYLSLGNTVRNIEDLEICNLSKNTSLSESFKKDSLGLPKDSCRESAQYYYEQAEDNSRKEDSSLNNINIVKSQLNHLSLLVEELQEGNHYDKDYENKIISIKKKIISELKPNESNETAISRAQIQAKINLAQSLVCLQPQPSKNELKYPSPIIQQCNGITLNSSEITSWEEIEDILTSALKDSQQLNNKRLEAYILGYLGGIALQQGNLDRAESCTKQSLELAPRGKWKNITYPWFWQLGRIYRDKENISDAIKTYESAFHNLKSLRGELVSINSDLQFNFRDIVEPIYRELVDVLLEDENPTNENLIQAREVIEELQLAELDNYFLEPCINANPKDLNDIINDIKKPTAVIYGITLEERLEVILQFPGNKKLLNYKKEINKIELENKVNEFLKDLNRKGRTLSTSQGSSQDFYDWFILPAKEKLEQNHIKDLVFVLDGRPRSIPMSALYNCTKKVQKECVEGNYLIEQYSVVLVPGLQLLETKNLDQIKKEKLKILALGMSTEEEYEILGNLKKFNLLKYVPIELNYIQQIVDKTDKLLDDSFSYENLVSRLENNKYNILHFATHAEFNPKFDSSFIAAPVSPIYVKELNRILRVEKGNRSIPVELIVFSACKTAIGNERSILGIAGFAIRAGIRSTISSLWSVKDESTSEFMRSFYDELNKSDEISKAQAIQEVQKKFIKSEKWNKPYYWAPFVLIGNWQ